MFVMSTAITILITLVRHGQTDYNLKHFTQGQSNIPLNDEGRNQAVLAGKSLKNQNFDVIYSSDLLRAFETAEKIIEQSDVLKSSYQIRSEILLRETSHGVFENRPSEDLKNAAKAAGFVEPELKKFRPQNGENEDDVSIRAQTFLTKILKEDCEKQKANSDILVVSHGLLLRELLKVLLEVENSGKEKVDGWRAKLLSGTGPNTGISQFNLDIDANCDIISATCLSFLSDDHLNKCVE